MPGIGEISLAVIAAASVVAVLAAMPALAQIRRTAARAETLLGGLERSLPALVADLRDTAAKADRALTAAGGLADTVERMNRLTATTTRTLEQTRAALRRVAATVAPSAASAVGLLTVLREGIQWVWPRGMRRRDSL